MRTLTSQKRPGCSQAGTPTTLVVAADGTLTRLWRGPTRGASRMKLRRHSTLLFRCIECYERCMVGAWRGGVALCVLFCLPLTTAQTPRRQLSFEVASVKSADSSGPKRVSSMRQDPGRVAYANVSLSTLITAAYGLRTWQLDGLSRRSGRYDVVAKIPEGATRQQIPEMLQTLLAERFGLKAHRESRIQPVYVLVVGRQGPKLTRSDADAIPTVGGPGGSRDPSSASFSTSGHLEFPHTSLARFADALSNFLDRPVLDATGLEGNYDFVLNISPEELRGMKNILTPRRSWVNQSSSSEVSSFTSDPTGSIFSDMQRLGLKLEARKAPIEHLVIDKLEVVPIAN